MTTEIEDLMSAKDYHKEIVKWRQMRNHHHNLLRGAKEKRDKYNQRVKTMIQEVQTLKDKRNNLNKEIENLKSSRDKYVHVMKQSKVYGRATTYVNAAKQQELFHKKVDSTAKKSQDYHFKMEKISDEITGIRDKANNSHKEMVELKKKADEYHGNMIDVIEKLQKIKDKYGLEHIDFDEINKLNIKEVSLTEEE